jgi:hypothetical protein
LSVSFPRGSGRQRTLPLLFALAALAWIVTTACGQGLVFTQLQSLPDFLIFGEPAIDTTGGTVSAAASALISARQTVRTRLQVTGSDVPRLNAYIVSQDGMARLAGPSVLGLFGSFEVQVAAGGTAHPLSGPGIILCPMPGRSEQFREVVLHEYTHATVCSLSNFDAVPRWLHEGLAEYCALDTGEIAAQANAHQHNMEQPNWRRTLVSPIDLNDMAFATMDWDHTYRTSLVFVDSLMHRGGPGAMRAFLRELGRGSALEAAFRRAYATDLTGVVEDFCR